MKPTKEYKGRSHIRMFNADCMDFMDDCDKYELAIVDPPYGIGWDKDNLENYNSTSCDAWKKRKPKGYKKGEWDSERPSKDFFSKLLTVSNNQIIWGGNYFTDILKPTGGWICWDKGVVMPTFSDGELAWQSITNSLKIVEMLWAGYRKCEETDRMHPTQKTIKLYKWLLTNYAKEGDRILDTHGGSFSIAIACWDLGFDLDIIELDEDYFNDAVKRFENHISQTQLF